MSGGDRPDSKEVRKARETLGLSRFATLREIKRAYREKCRLWHPDADPGNDTEEHKKRMQAINEAYDVLLRFCRNYRYCLDPREEPDDENWWMDRFGDDPVWSRKSDSK